MTNRATREKTHAAVEETNEQQKRPLLDLPKVIAAGIASPAGAALTSRFGVTGTLLGLALSAVVITVVTDLMKVYLQRVPGAVTTIPGGLRNKSAGRRFAAKLRLPFSKFASLPPARRRSILVGSIIGGGIAFVIGLSAVTALELSVGKNLSCWVWNECPEAAASSTDSAASTTSTAPSILGGGSSLGTNASQVTPANPQPTEPSASPGAFPTSSSPPPASSGSQTPNPSPPADEQESSSSTPEGYEQCTSEEHEQSSSDHSENQQQHEYQQHSEYTESSGKSGGQHQQAR